MRSKRIASHPDLPLPVLLCAIRTARRLRLRLDEREGLLKVTHPRHVRPAAALEWAATQKSWVADQLRQSLPPEPLEPGSLIPLEGRNVTLAWSEHEPRRPTLVADTLTCGGPLSGFARNIERFLRDMALERLSNETAEAAAKAGVRPSSVRVGDARTRWGSCSSKGDVRYSWRLILAPPEARRYVVAHEVAHLKHLNHGAAFKTLERELFAGDLSAAEILLRKCGPRLRRIGLAR